MNFDIGREYERRALHREYGGNWQGGIAPSRTQPIVFVFTDESGAKHGYEDGFQKDGVFWYTGEGQHGDMQMIRGNLAVLESEQTGKELHVFQRSGPRHYRYLGQAHYITHHETRAPDTSGASRRAIIFHLELGAEGAAADVPDLGVRAKRRRRTLGTLSLAALRKRAIEQVSKAASGKKREVAVRTRSEAVKAYVLMRAAGTCESCGQRAPFVNHEGEHYLEPHHILRLADEGPDHPRWVGAICPNCHREIHYGRDGKARNAALARHLEKLEEG